MSRFRSLYLLAMLAPLCAFPAAAIQHQDFVTCIQNGGDYIRGLNPDPDETVVATINGDIRSLPSISEDFGGCVPAAMARAIIYLASQTPATDSIVNNPQGLYDLLVAELNAHERVSYDPKTGSADSVYGWSGSRPNWLEAKERVLNRLRQRGQLTTNISSTQARPQAGDWSLLVNTIISEITNGAAVELHVDSHISVIWRVTRSKSNPNVYNFYIADDRSGTSGDGQGDGRSDTSSRGPIKIDVSAETCTLGGKPCGPFHGIIIERRS